jgi:1-acyl-sn-glycerol-3-phosphate acyltransferase
VIWLRSLIYNIVFYVNLVLFLVLGTPFYLTPRKWSVRALQAWASTSVWWLRIICGTRMEVRGAENIPEGAVLVASKHQSTWDTFALLPLFDDPAMVLKRELIFIPLFGWFIPKFRMIPIARSSGAATLKNMVARAKEAAAMGRQIVIFPEGTRRAPGAAPDYKPGAAALYLQLDLPCLPIALNSGVFWPRRKFLRHPGTIVVEILPAIEAGLKRREFSQRLEAAIETATARLLEQARGPASYIEAAFRSLGIAVHELKMTDYAPETFGNLVCHAYTGIGHLRIVYDRQFEIEIVGDHKYGDAQTISALIGALEQAKRRSVF